MPAALGPENFGVKLVGRNEIGAREPGAETRDGAAEPGARCGAGAQPAPQSLPAAAMAQLEQGVLVDVEERPLQHRGQGQIVLRKQQKPAERHQILHRQLLAQHQAVGAGDRDVAHFQRAQQFADEVVAATHQHHDVAGAQRAVARLEPLAAAEPLPDRRRDRAGEPGARLCDPAVGHRQRLGIGLVLRHRHDRGPQLDQSRLPGAGGEMADLRPVERDPVLRTGLPKDRIDRAQHRLGRAKRDFERQDLPILAGIGDPFLKMPPHGQEFLRVGPLKAVDRLLGVADGKDRPGPVARAFAGKELFGQRRHDLPLFGVGVLGLVDQDVVETAVELEEDPGRHSRARQQVARGQHQIVEIERALEPLAGVIGPQQRFAEPGERTARLAHHDRGPRRAQPLQPLGLRGEDRPGVAAGLGGRGLGNQRLPSLALVRQKDALIRRQHLAAALRLGAPRVDHRAALAIGVRSGGEGSGDGAQSSLVAGIGSAEFGSQALRGCFERHAQRRRELVAQRAVPGGQGPAQLAALAGERPHQLGKALLGGIVGDDGERLGKGRVASAARGDDHLLGGLGQRLPGAALLDHREFGRYPGLERKAAQQGLTEGVDRGDLDAARGVEHPREQLARAGDQRLVRKLSGQLHQRLRQRAGRHRRPFRQPGVEPVRHLGRSGAGKGQAQHAGGIGAVEHQPQQPLGQHRGLAGPGRGRDPDRAARPGGAPRGLGGGAHSSASLRSTRSRWR